MFKRGLALSLVLGLASVARADVEVRLVPSPSANPFNPAGYYDSGETNVSVDVYLSTDGGQDLLLRHVQFNLDGTDAALGLTMPITHSPSSGDIRFWDFSSVAACAGDVEQCGAGHYIDDSNAAGPAGIGITYFSTSATPVVPDDTDADSAVQVLLPADGSCVRIGTLDVAMPADGDYLLDLVNVTEVDPELAGRVSYGFGLATSLAGAGTVEEANDLMAVTTNGTGASALNGGTVMLRHIGQNLMVSTPDESLNLPRVLGHALLLEFDFDLGALDDMLALQGLLEVNEILPGGLGPNINPLIGSPFTFTVKNNGSAQPRVLLVRDTGNTLVNETWYRFRNTAGWAPATPFEVDLPVVMGDQNGDGSTGFGDLSDILGLQTPSASDDSRADMNGDGSVTFGDVSDALGFTSPASTEPAKPDLHPCLP